MGGLWYRHGYFGTSQILHPLHSLVHTPIQQPFTEAFPRAEIYEIISPDLLHQLIKGTFKDHLVEWVIDYIEAEHTTRDAKRIKDIIDRRSAGSHSLLS